MASVSKEEYLKRYLSNDAARAKVKKKIKPKNAVRKANVRIIDDDADLKTLKSTAAGVDVSDDEAPTVAEFIDERPQHIRRLEEYRNTGRWKVLGENNSRNGITSKDYGVASVGGIVAGDNAMADTKNACYSHSTYSGKRHIDSDLDTPPRANRHQLVSDQSQHSNRRHDTDSDSSSSHKSNGANKKSSQNSVLTGKIQPKQNSDSYHVSHRYKGNSNNQPVSMKRHGNDSDPSLVRKQRHDSDFDHSPIRKQRHDSDSDHSPVRKQRHDSDSDHSSIRKQRCDSDSDCSPVRENRHDSDSDHSPVRKQSYGNDSHHSPVRKRGLNSASDQSVPRRQLENCSYRSPGRRYKTDCDPSPPRIRKEESDSDQSPPRRRKGGLDSDQSPPRRRKGGSDSDQSPPRKSKGGSDSDQSPPRKRKGGSDSDQSPPRKRKGGSDSDQSPPRKRKEKSDSDQLPPRKRQVEIDSNCSTTKNILNEKNMVKPSKTLGGAKAGLSTAKEMKQESDTLRRKEDKMFSMIDKNELGKDAKTVFRDKSGKRKDLAAEKEKEEEELKKAAEKDKKYKEWGQGLKQKEMKDENIQDYIHEMSKPLARYKDDEDLDKIMREMEREGDPMAAFMKKKSKIDDNLNAKPRYRGPPPPPNRFGILPGYRWDGVDRSNGFERKIFAKMADKKAIKEQAYKWSIEDM